MRYALPLLLLMLAACGDKPAQDAPILIIPDEELDSGGGQDMPPADMALDLAPDQAPDMAEDMPSELDQGPDMPDMPPSPLPSGPLPQLPSCAERGLEAAPFDAAADGAALDTRAGDLTVQTSRGAWTLSAQWSGCDHFVFLNHYNNANVNTLWGTLNERLFQQSDPNTVYLFGAYGASEEAVLPALVAQRERIELALNKLPADQQARWRDRVHYITQPITQAQGSLGRLVTTSSLVQTALAVDTRQRWDFGGSLTNIGFNGFVADLNVAAYMGRYYTFRAALERRLAAEQAVTIVPLMAEQRVTQNNDLYTLTLPDAATMATFDTLEIDVAAKCGPAPTDCGEWDYEAFLQRCRDEVCAEADEIVLWITQYARPGSSRWVVDATPFLPLFASGGVHKLRFGMLWNMNPNTMNVSLRLSARGAPRPRAIVPAFTGGDFNADYNTGRAPLTFEPPAGTTRVELVSLLTGHGQEAGNNCAEWCDHVHTFTVNAGEADERAFVRSFPNQAGKAMGCAALVDEGVVPGQYGNWTPQRAAWCPGQAVQPHRQDITAAVRMGGPNTLTYRGGFRGGPPAGGRIRLSSYLVFY